MHKITDHLHWCNEERTFSQADGTLFGGLLRKEHEIARGPPNPWRGQESQFGLGQIGYGKQRVKFKIAERELRPDPG